MPALEDSTSASLLKRLESDDRESAWNRFVGLYAPLILQWAKQQGLRESDAADLVQDVMSILIVQMPRFRYQQNGSFRGWLRTVTVNASRTHHRRVGRRRSVELDPDEISHVEADNVGVFAEQEYRRFLAQRAFLLMKQEFNENDWRACWMHVVEGQSAREIAQQLGITANMVYLAKSRILARLRRELDGLFD